MNTKAQLRRASDADAEVLAAFNIAMAKETENKTLSTSTVKAGVKRMIAEPHRGFYLVAEQAGQVQASLMVTYEWSDWRNADFWWIQSVYVRPEARRQGYYSQLYASIKAMATAEKACGLRLYAETENLRAHRTYTSLGMQACEYIMFAENL